MELDASGKERLRRLRCWAQGKPMPPIRMELEPTDRCNLSCVFCWRQDPVRMANSKKTAAEEAPDERLLRLVDEACDLGIIEWRIGGGGEPMIKRSVLVPMMLTLKERGVTGLLTTNGTLFEPQDIRQLVSQEWDLIEFSIDGPNADTHDRLRGRQGGFERAMQALQLFNQEKKRQRKRLPRLALNMVLVNENYTLLPAMIEMCHELGIEVFSMNPITIFAPEGEGLKLKAAELKSFQPLLVKAMEMAKSYGIANSLVDLADMELVAKTGEMTEVLRSDSQAATEATADHTGQDASGEPVDDYSGEKDAMQEPSTDHAPSQQEQPSSGMPSFFSAPCFMPWYIMVIRGGMIGPCSGFEGKFPAFSEVSIAEIWYGEELHNFRRRLLQGDLPHFCSWCSANMVAEHRRSRQLLIDNYHAEPQVDCCTTLSVRNPSRQKSRRWFGALRRRLFS